MGAFIEAGSLVLKYINVGTVTSNPNKKILKIGYIKLSFLLASISYPSEKPFFLK